MDKKKKGFLKTIILIAISITLMILIDLGIVLFLSNGFNDQYDITTDLSQYETVIGNSKWGMNEDIFPETISDKNVTDFKYVYYNPWDANYLAYLVIDYQDKAEYNSEISRLRNLGISEYLGYYSVTGFTKYSLVAMNADSYNGFIYAITDNESIIIYVEIFFCNYYMDIKYEEQIPNDYLPDGFNAKLDNPYQKSQQ